MKYDKILLVGGSALRTWKNLQYQSTPFYSKSKWMASLQYSSFDFAARGSFVRRVLLLPKMEILFAQLIVSPTLLYPLLLNAKQGSSNSRLLTSFGMTRPGFETKTSRLWGGCSTDWANTPVYCLMSTQGSSRLIDYFHARCFWWLVFYKCNI